MLYDYQNCIDFAREKGIAEGKVEGKAEIAINMLKNHLPIEQVSLYTGMSESEINKLLAR